MEFWIISKILIRVVLEWLVRVCLGVYPVADIILRKRYTFPAQDSHPDDHEWLSASLYSCPSTQLQQKKIDTALRTLHNETSWMHF